MEDFCDNHFETENNENEKIYNDEIIEDNKEDNIFKDINGNSKFDNNLVDKKQVKNNNDEHLINNNKLLITLDVVQEMFQFKNLKRLSLASAIFWGIMMFPFFLATIFLTGCYFVTFFIVKLTSCPADYLISKMKEDADCMPVKIVTYLIGYSTVFVIWTFLSLISVMFFIYHFLITLFAYIFSFGGVTFHAFLFDDGYKKFNCKNDKFSKKVNITIIVIGSIFILGLVLTSIFLPLYNHGYLDIKQNNNIENIVNIDAEEYNNSSNECKIYNKGKVKFIDCQYVNKIYIKIQSNDINNVKVKINNDYAFYVMKNSEYFYPTNNIVNINNVVYGDVLLIKINDNNIKSIYVDFY